MLMTLEQCSKADLRWIIDRMCMYSLNKRDLIRALGDLECKKEMDRIDAADKYAKLAHEKRQAYIDLLKPYDGMKLVDIPMPILDKAAELQKQANAADREWNKLMGIELRRSPKKRPDVEDEDGTTDN